MRIHEESKLLLIGEEKKDKLPTEDAQWQHLLCSYEEVEDEEEEPEFSWLSDISYDS